jgi:hypothetical protein
MSATICRPSARGLHNACKTFQQFHCFSPEQIDRVPYRRIIPKVLVRIGELRGLIYRSDRGQKGRPRTFVHFLESPTALACDPSGRQLYVLGGNYRVTPRGIEG